MLSVPANDTTTLRNLNTTPWKKLRKEFREQLDTFVHTVLKEALSHAVKWELISRNVGDAVDPPRAVDQEMNALDPDGVERLLDAARSTMYFPLIHLATFTGMRRSELLGLRWENIKHIGPGLFFFVAKICLMGVPCDDKFST